MNELWVGFDEAGLGPILGPLSLSIFISPEQYDSEIVDSKKVHKKGNLIPLMKKCKYYCPTIEKLEVQGSITDLNSLGVKNEPWFLNDPSHEVETEPLFHHCEISSHLYSRLIAVSDYNKVLDKGYNKADTVLHFMKPMIQKVFEHATSYDRVNLIFDRLGGRKKYRPILESWNLSVASAHENPEVSRYSCHFQGQPWDVSFRVKGDLYHHTTAAASMFSKLRRELSMERMNHWWAERVPGLKPTAGYWTDGLRFLRDIDFYRSNHKISEDLLRRKK